MSYYPPPAGPGQWQPPPPGQQGTYGPPQGQPGYQQPPPGGTGPPGPQYGPPGGQYPAPPPHHGPPPPPGHHPQHTPPGPPYAGPPQQHGPPPGQYGGPPPQHGPPAGQYPPQPQYGAPAQPQYGGGPVQQYGSAPQYSPRPPEYGAPAAPYAGGPPPSQPPQQPQQQPYPQYPPYQQQQPPQYAQQPPQAYSQPPPAAYPQNAPAPGAPPHGPPAGGAYGNGLAGYSPSGPGQTQGMLGQALGQGLGQIVGQGIGQGLGQAHGPQAHMNYGESPQAIPLPQTGQYGLPVTPGNHVSPFSKTFKVEELVASTTQDSFAVQDMDGRLVYKINGSYSVNERKTMVDMHGRTLLKVKEARLAPREKLTISSANGSPVMVVQQSGAVQLGSKTAKAYLGGRAHGIPIFSINGNRGATHFRLTDNGGRELAVIVRKANSIKHKLTGQDSYETTVMPNVDQALMMMVTVCIDEIWCD